MVKSYGNDRFDFRAFGDRRQLELKMQYALQCRHDERKVKTAADTGRAVIAFVAAADVGSLLDWPLESWDEFFTSGRAD
ncbi:hypothetical protein KO481_33415 [Nocardia sp. NEAU-G5]|uniref:Uncharacterized protein n=1 Tax=Nocardia albiluteola TaxID=2842303 RepID=A0ABS6B7X4_9NOCA|nr:hypothetical protein [Nocardia albiluteola]MBU3066408.1 hypothetical protein [Nocardia albiluteola]